MEINLSPDLKKDVQKYWECIKNKYDNQKELSPDDLENFKLYINVENYNIEDGSKYLLFIFCNFKYDQINVINDKLEEIVNDSDNTLEINNQNNTLETNNQKLTKKSDLDVALRIWNRRTRNSAVINRSRLLFDLKEITKGRMCDLENQTQTMKYINSYYNELPYLISQVNEYKNEGVGLQIENLAKAELEGFKNKYLDKIIFLCWEEKCDVFENLIYKALLKDETVENSYEINHIFSKMKDLTYNKYVIDNIINKVTELYQQIKIQHTVIINAIKNMDPLSCKYRERLLILSTNVTTTKDFAQFIFIPLILPTIKNQIYFIANFYMMKNNTWVLTSIDDVILAISNICIEHISYFIKILEPEVINCQKNKFRLRLVNLLKSFLKKFYSPDNLYKFLKLQKILINLLKNGADEKKIKNLKFDLDYKNDELYEHFIKNFISITNNKNDFINRTLCFEKFISIYFPSENDVTSIRNTFYQVIPLKLNLLISFTQKPYGTYLGCFLK